MDKNVHCMIYIYILCVIRWKTHSRSYALWIAREPRLRLIYRKQFSRIMEMCILCVCIYIYIHFFLFVCRKSAVSMAASREISRSYYARDGGAQVSAATGKHPTPTAAIHQKRCTRAGEVNLTCARFRSDLRFADNITYRAQWTRGLSGNACLFAKRFRRGRVKVNIIVRDNVYGVCKSVQ